MKKLILMAMDKAKGMSASELAAEIKRFEVWREKSFRTR
jgi:hypothetical protein